MILEKGSSDAEVWAFFFWDLVPIDVNDFHKVVDKLATSRSKEIYAVIREHDLIQLRCEIIDLEETCDERTAEFISDFSE